MSKEQIIRELKKTCDSIRWCYEDGLEKALEAHLAAIELIKKLKP